MILRLGCYVSLISLCQRRSQRWFQELLLNARWSLRFAATICILYWLVQKAEWMQLGTTGMHRESEMIYNMQNFAKFSWLRKLITEIPSQFQHCVKRKNLLKRLPCIFNSLINMNSIWFNLNDATQSLLSNRPQGTKWIVININVVLC